MITGPTRDSLTHNELVHFGACRALRLIIEQVLSTAVD